MAVAAGGTPSGGPEGMMGRKAWWAAGALVLGAMVLMAVAALAAEPGAAPAVESEFETWRKIGLGGSAAAAISLCVAGSAYAVARIGSAAIGAAAERPELLNRSLVFVALAEGLAVLGFVIAMMLVQRI